MKINHYNAIVVGAECSVLAIAACRIIDLGGTTKDAADLLNITREKAGKLYERCSERLAKVAREQQERSGYIQGCTDHFAHVRTMFKIDWTDYCIMRLIAGMKKPPTKLWIAKAVGSSANLVAKKMRELVEIGAVLSCQTLPIPCYTVEQMQHRQMYGYTCTIHDIFKHIENR